MVPKEECLNVCVRCEHYRCFEWNVGWISGTRRICLWIVSLWIVSLLFLGDYTCRCVCATIHCIDFWSCECNVRRRSRKNWLYFCLIFFFRIQKGSSALLVRFRIDDPLDASGVHGACGLVGAILLGFFADPILTGRLRADAPAGIFVSCTNLSSGWIVTRFCLVRRRRDIVGSAIGGWHRGCGVERHCFVCSV